MYYHTDILLLVLKSGKSLVKKAKENSFLSISCFPTIIERLFLGSDAQRFSQVNSIVFIINFFKFIT